jgi:hypothetical protein
MREIRPAWRGRASGCEGYRLLSKLLHSIEVDPENSEDIFWQINRPRASKSISGRINRLSKWSVLQTRAMTIQVGGEASIAASAGPSQFAVRVDLDVNTPPSDESLPPDQIPLILDELWNSADEIAANGDVP